jgi:hypothetical protein
MAYPQQINAAVEIISKFDETTYVMLLAEMQSGKTGTFLLVICEMIREGLVDYGVIFTGNREIELKEQTEKSRDDFFVTYAEYLTNKGIDLSIIETIKNGNKIKVVWGPDLKKFKALGKTIYVWEESHFGQSKTQEVDKFITDLGIDPTGNSAPEGCFVLSVSATPFSEFTANVRNQQHKHIVRMRSPDSYRGVKKMCQDKQIHTYSYTPEKQFKKCLAMSGNGYAIVRGMTKKLIKIAQSKGWATKIYDLHSKWKINDVLSVEPEQPTVIFIKGKLRMGKVIIKTHLLWCLETSNNPKTDTLVQGLLGRCCGYDSRADIHIYIKKAIREDKREMMVSSPNGRIPQKWVNRKGKTKTRMCIVKVNTVVEELKLFISWHDNEIPEMAFAPRRGINMTEGSRYCEQIPLKVLLTTPEWETLYDVHNGDDARSTARHVDLGELHRILKDKDEKGEIHNKNAGTESKITFILDTYANPFQMRYPHTKLMNPANGEKPINKIIRAFESGTQIKGLGAGLGVSLGELSVFPIKSERCLYITFCLPSLIGKTTRREVFSNTPLPGRIRPPVELVELHTDLLTRLCNVQVMRMISL